MTKSEGKNRIDAVEVLEVSFDFLTPVPRMTAKYAYMDSGSGDRLGFGNRNQAWSAETLSRLEGLVESMERDVVGSVFSGESTEGGVSGPLDPTSDGVPAL